MENLLVEGERPELRAKMAIDLKCCPLTAISRRYPELSFSIVEKQDLKDGVLASLLVEKSEVGDDFLEKLAADDEVRNLRRIGDSKDGWKMRISLGCQSCFVREIAEGEGVIPDEMVFGDGSMMLTFALESHDEFRSLLKRIEETDAEPPNVLELFHGEEKDLYADDPLTRSGITDRQLEILRYAYKKGYFDRSRRINIGEIADEFELHPSTVSSHLRVGMRKVLDQLL